MATAISKMWAFFLDNLFHPPTLAVRKFRQTKIHGVKDFVARNLVAYIGVCYVKQSSS